VRRSLLAPLSGVAFIAVVIIGFAIGGEPPDAESSPDEIVAHYVDNKDSIQIGAAIATAGLVLLILFANYLRRLFAAAGDAPLSATILVGAAITAVGAAFDGTLSIAIAEAADDITPESVETLQALWDEDFLPLALGALVFLLSAGVSILQTGVLPAWLGWVAIALVVLGFTPIGFVSFLGTAIWIIIVSVLLAARAPATGAPATGPPTPPTTA
jgi:hypothetical protein